MSLRDRLDALHDWDHTAVRPFIVGDERLGWVTHAFARRLTDFPRVFEVGEASVRVDPRLKTCRARSEAVQAVVQALVEAGDIAKLRGEDYPVLPYWGAEPRMLMERAAVTYFGVRSYGVHVNGICRGPAGLEMWVGRRAANKSVAPGKLDHLVAGGQPHGLSIFENLIKEAAEEADVPEALARRAVPVGAVSYLTRYEGALRNDVLFCYDLELPLDFVPRNTDGEVAEFQRWPIEAVVARLAEGDDFKFNVGVVIIDFLVRHGILDPEHPDYEALLHGMRKADCREA